MVIGVMILSHSRIGSILRAFWCKNCASLSLTRPPPHPAPLPTRSFSFLFFFFFLSFLRTGSISKKHIHTPEQPRYLSVRNESYPPFCCCCCLVGFVVVVWLVLLLLLVCWFCCCSCCLCCCCCFQLQVNREK